MELHLHSCMQLALRIHFALSLACTNVAYAYTLYEIPPLQRLIEKIVSTMNKRITVLSILAIVIAIGIFWRFQASAPSIESNVKSNNANQSRSNSTVDYNPMEYVVQGIIPTSCQIDTDCMNIYLDCSSCNCASVSKSYKVTLDCTNYKGAKCDYDCKLNRIPSCQNGTCQLRNSQP